MKNEKSIALVLCGGGAKGAYQIGVWKYLEEQGYKIEGISGSSVGALNALLIAQGDLALAENVWNTVEQSDYTRPRGMNSDGSDLDLFDLAIPALELYMMQFGGDPPALFSNSGLRSLISDSIYDWKKVRSMKHLYACVAKVPEQLLEKPYLLFSGKKQDAVYIRLSDYDKDRIIDYAMASSAIPIAFKAQKIDGESYIDGGWADNIPAAPLLKAGFDKIVIVHLKEETSDEIIERLDSLKGYDLSGRELIDIYPSVKLGLTDSLRIDRDRITELMQAGYDDARNAFDRGYKVSTFSYEDFDYDKAYNELIEHIKKPNIFICGRTGAGKSSLVNDIFSLNEDEMAPIGSSTPKTKGIHEYSSDNIVLIDTEGYEVANDKFLEEIVGEIDRRIHDNPLSVERHVHGAWYCVNAGEKRFLDNDKKIINEIQKRDVPVMIVITKVDTVDEDELNALKDEIHMQCPGVPCYTYSVMADDCGWDEDIKKQYVQKTEMVDWATSHLPENFRSTFLSAVKGEITLKRKYCMKKIVLPHSVMATVAVTGTSMVNVPFSDSVPLMTIQIRMTMSILSEYGIKADITTIMKDLAGSTMISYIGRTMASQIIGIIPFAGQVAKSVVNVSVATSITAILGASIAYLCEGYLKTCVDQNGNANMDFLKYFTGDNIKKAMNFVKENRKEFYIDDIINDVTHREK